MPTYIVLTPAGRIVAMSRVLDGVTPYLTGDVELWRDGEPVTLPPLWSPPATPRPPRAPPSEPPTPPDRPPALGATR